MRRHDAARRFARIDFDAGRFAGGRRIGQRSADQEGRQQDTAT
jgi:hypothetical protein